MQPHNRPVRALAWITIITFCTSNVLAGPITLATAPVVNGVGKVVAPNIFFILDDSLSMNSEYMPDSVNDDSDDDDQNDYSEQKKPCTLNFGYNTIYYDPSTHYYMPVDSTGANRSYVPSFTSALPNGYAAPAAGNVSVDLSSVTPVYKDVTTATFTLGSNPIATTVNTRNITVTHNAHGRAVGDRVVLTGLSGTTGGVNLSNLNNITFTITAVSTNTYTFAYTSAQGARASSTAVGGGSGTKRDQFTYTVFVEDKPIYHYYAYTANPTSPPASCAADGLYSRRTATSHQGYDPVLKATRTVAQEQANFAIWYSYYRTRLLMMKSAAGRAFSGVTDAYRVGFTTISEKGTGSSKFLDIAKFGATQKASWYSKLYNATGASFTPLRGALSKAGRYYAGKLADPVTGARDPVQYSCQRNFTILTTDGFWNTNDEDSTYGPKKINNSDNVGDQDGVNGVGRPYYDSSQAQNTLADVAYYYYYTDLRPAGSIGGVTEDGVTRVDVGTKDNVPESATDPAKHQHMTTFTLGLGVDGTLSNPGAYNGIVGGNTSWPNPIVSTTPGSIQESRRIDDLWHAAVNGHGIIGQDGGNLSAKKPDTLVSELNSALQAIQAETGSSSAAATSNLQPINGDNAAFIAQYKTVAWTGDLLAREINVSTGAIPSTNTWSARDKLEAMASRTIYTYSSATTTHLRSFAAANLTATELDYFKSGSGNPNGALPQWASLSAAQQAAATESAMIDYLRGVRTNENPGAWTSPAGLFRQREHILGDIVSAAPVFVRKPPFAYLDTGYATFKGSTAIQSRLPTVYVGANDGMLHAFNGSTKLPGANLTDTSDDTVDPEGGKERWAYIPGLVLKNIYKLAASDYATTHRFFVDGPITVGDAYSGTAWSTILVGGLGGGGKGYYALDVTDPGSPKALWEFGNTPDYVGDTTYDADMGYSYGNPVITKRESDNKWVVIFASGYNNSAYNATTNPTGTGDAKGRLYVLDAFTGEKLSELITGTTADEDLSGIARVSNLVMDGLRNNVTQYVYGGDLSGSLWRFDISNNAVQLLGSTSATPGARPITVQPELARINSAHTVVYFGTGRNLGPNDLTGPSAAVQQMIYAVKDTGSDLGVLTNSSATLVSQTLDSSVTPRTSTSNTVDWTTKNGWYLTVPVGERFNVDPGLQLGTLVMAANIPDTDYCFPKGSSVLYQLSYKNGAVLKTSTFQAQVVGNTQVQLGGSDGSGTVYGGKVVIESVLADGTTINTDQSDDGGPAGTAVRVSWREIE